MAIRLRRTRDPDPIDVEIDGTTFRLRLPDGPSWVEFIGGELSRLEDPADLAALCSPEGNAELMHRVVAWAVIGWSDLLAPNGRPVPYDPSWTTQVVDALPEPVIWRLMILIANAVGVDVEVADA